MADSNISINSSLLGAFNSLNKVNERIALSSQRISSSERINSARDDAAGVAISSRLEAQTQGYNVAIRNAGDGISLAQTTVGGLSKVNDALQRINELSLQSANGTLTDSDRQALQAEAQTLAEEVSSVIDKTSFNGVKLLNEQRELNFAIGPNEGDTLRADTVDLSDLRDQINQIDISTQQGANNALDTLESGLETLSGERARVGAIESRFESAISSREGSRFYEQQALSRINDADLASETARLTQEQVRSESGLAVISQANSDAERVLQLLG